jgi:hypothetical protein
VYLVYWSTGEDGTRSAHSEPFGSDRLSAALAFMETLRSRQRAGEAISFVTMCSENPDSVGAPGAADPSPDYDWKKRRR